MTKMPRKAAKKHCEMLSSGSNLVLHANILLGSETQDVAKSNTGMTRTLFPLI